MKETFKLRDAPPRQTFTQANGDVSVVFYEDTNSQDIKKTYHSYLNGDIYSTTAYPNPNEDYITCDVYGNYIPRSYVDKCLRLQTKVEKLYKQNKELIKELTKELTKKTFKTSLKVYP